MPPPENYDYKPVAYKSSSLNGKNSRQYGQKQRLLFIVMVLVFVLVVVLAVVLAGMDNNSIMRTHNYITNNPNTNLNNQIYQKYYERKRIAMVMEENNNSKIIAIPSLAKGAKDEWLKLGGNSAYFYKYLVAPRLNKKPPTIHQDTDLNYRFKSGIIAIHWKGAFIKNMQALNLELNEESGLLVFEMGRKFTTAEIKKLRLREAEVKNKTNRLLKPKITTPELYNQFLILAQTLPNKVRKLDEYHRQVYGARINDVLIRLFEDYIELSEGGDKDKIRQRFILYIHRLNAILIILNENHALDYSTAERLGTLIIDIKNTITRNLG